MKRSREKIEKKAPSLRDVKERELDQLAEHLNTLTHEQRIDYLAENYGRLLSEEVDLHLELPIDEDTLFKWFIAALVFGHPVKLEPAKETIRALFAKQFTPETLNAASESEIMACLQPLQPATVDSVVKALKRNALALVEKYGGRVQNLLAQPTPALLYKALRSFARMGDVTTNLFLRELRLQYDVDPEPVAKVVQLAEKFDINLTQLPRKTRRFLQLEAALHRLASGATSSMLARKTSKKKTRLETIQDERMAQEQKVGEEEKPATAAPQEEFASPKVLADTAPPQFAPQLPEFSTDPTLVDKATSATPAEGKKEVKV